MIARAEDGQIPGFDYATAFSRNIGWLTPADQDKLRHSRVAVAGNGGVGGRHVETLARLGVGAFTIADFDRFAVHNFNRQIGATMSNLDREKSAVIAAMALDINPELDIRVFAEGVTEDNLGAFLDGVDVYVDGIDFFALPVRRQIFAECAKRGIPAVTAAPLGMGAALLIFRPGGMSFDEYFRLEGCDFFEQQARFIAGLSPAMPQRRYLAVPNAVNFEEKRGPSTVMACDLCAGIMGVEVLKLLIGRGKISAAPWGLHFDAYRQTLHRTWRPFGNANPLQKLLLLLIRRKLRGS